MTLLPKSYSQQYDRYWMGINWHFELTEVMMRFDENQFYTNGNVVVSWDHTSWRAARASTKGRTARRLQYPWDPDTTYNVPYTPTLTASSPIRRMGIYYMVHAFVIERTGGQFGDS
jgi:hypothetical protein